MKTNFKKFSALLFVGLMFTTVSCGGDGEEEGKEAKMETVQVMTSSRNVFSGNAAIVTVLSSTDNFTDSKDLKIINGNKLIAVNIAITNNSEDTDLMLSEKVFTLDAGGKSYKIDGISSLKMSDAYDGDVGYGCTGVLYYQVPADAKMDGMALKIADDAEGASIALKKGAKIEETSKDFDGVLKYESYSGFVEIKCSKVTEYMTMTEEYSKDKGFSLLKVDVTMTNNSSDKIYVLSSGIQLASKFYQDPVFLSNADGIETFDSESIPAGGTVETTLYYNILPGDSDFTLVTRDNELAL